MAEPYFVWKDINSKDMGVVVNNYPPIIRPKERVQEIAVPGRAGTLTNTEGEDVYEQYVRACQCYIRPSGNINSVTAWLRGSGNVVFGNESSYAYRARIDNQISLDKILANHEHRSFAIPFVCQPFKYQAAPVADIVKTTSGQSITNPGTAASLPWIKVEGNGDITLVIGTYQVNFTGVSGGIIMDSEMMDCYDLTATSLLNEKMHGEFPRLIPGANTISWIGTGTVSKVTIRPRWRWL